MDEDAIWDKEVERQLSVGKEIIHTNNELINSGKVKKIRGPVYCRKLTALAPGEKIYMDFDEDGNPIGKYASTFSYFIGDKIRNRSVCPVQVSGWEDFKVETLDHLWRCITEIFDFDHPELRRDGVMKHARALFRYSRIGEQHSLGLVPAFPPHPKRLTFLSDEVPQLLPSVGEKSNKAKESRSFQKMPHYTGSKSHARVKEEIKERTGECSRVDLLLETRKRKSESPVNSLSLDYNMKTIEEVKKLKKVRAEGLTQKIDDEILMQVLGQDTHGYLRCYGRGKNITQYFGVKPSRINLAREVVEVRRTAENAVEQAKNEALKARKEVEDIQKAAEADKKEVEAKVDQKIAANNKMWDERFQNLMKSYAFGPSQNKCTNIPILSKLRAAGYCVWISNAFEEKAVKVVKAYQYTSLTSVMLLDCWAIPCVIILTWIFLKTKYGWRKLVGVAVCVLGLVLVVFSDVYAQDRKARGSNPLKGDLFVIAGSTLYAVSNVSEEYLVKKADTVELMAMLGAFGAVISAIQISILERNELKSIHWSAGAALPFVGFSVAMFLFYSLVPVLLKISGSTMLNLSLLTSDMWSVVIRIFAYREKVDWLYYVAFAGVAVGLVIYSWGDKVEEKARGRDVAKTEEEGSRSHDEELDVRSSNQDIATDSVRRGPSFDVEHKDEVVPSVS
ncbi:hypothetical protein KSS87_021876 [Heliosperma pusillum]|nr:hypothetical protein KSS87_021876 [Heliosperma pusillum]